MKTINKLPLSPTRSPKPIDMGKILRNQWAVIEYYNQHLINEETVINPKRNNRIMNFLRNVFGNRNKKA